jgi:hypothetical protein
MLPGFLHHSMGQGFARKEKLFNNTARNEFIEAGGLFIRFENHIGATARLILTPSQNSHYCFFI